jgi:AbrB family looped-hinge helix DNA binding protein
MIFHYSYFSELRSVTVDIARVSSKGQMTIPKRIREVAQLAEGDVVAFAVEADRIILRKITSRRDEYLAGVEESLSEWTSAEDEHAWRDL